MAKNSYRAGFLILPEKKLVIEYHQGLIVINTLIECKKQQAAHPDFSPDYDILVDLTKAVFTRKPKNVEKYVDYFAKHAAIGGAKKVALFAEAPDSVVIATLYQQMHQKLQRKPRIFSTLEIALRWLGDDMTTEDVSNILAGLRMSSEENIR